MRKLRKQHPWKLLLAISALLAALALFRWYMAPIMAELAKARVAYRASYLVNQAVNEQLQSGEIAYDRMILLEKDVHGNVTALKTNIAEMNRLKTQILSIVNDMLPEQTIQEIGIPLGNLLLPSLYAGRGPKLPVRILSVSAADAAFQNVFQEAGINQTTHQIRMEVQISMTILTPLGTERVTAASQVLVAETVVVGQVPKSYVNVK